MLRCNLALGTVLGSWAGLPGYGRSWQPILIIIPPIIFSLSIYVLPKLTSPAVEEKECACAGLANLVFEPGAIPVLIRQDVVRRLGPLLIDNNRSIQEAAAGALRY